MSTNISQLKQKYPGILIGVILAVFILSLVSLMASSKVEVEDIGPLTGKPLAAYQFYPVIVEDKKLKLDKTLFMNAVSYLAEHPDPRAISDLFYLGQANRVVDLLSDQEKKTYHELVKSYDFNRELEDINTHKDKIFSVYKDIVNGVGKTFANTPIEFVLHDTRNPLGSVVAVQNPITGRRLGSSTTNFGIKLIKDFHSYFTGTIKE